MIKINKPCTCGHYQNVHLPADGFFQAFCMYCDWGKNPQHEFKLDNLLLVENLAEQKGLIKKNRKLYPENKPWHWPFQRISDGPEYSCPHGVGHSHGIHGCDSCCRDLHFPKKKSENKNKKN